MDRAEKLAAFGILMENNEGIMTKAPGYIKEKWTSTQSAYTREHLEHLLDSNNLAKFHWWIDVWGKHLATPESTSGIENQGDLGPKPHNI